MVEHISWPDVRDLADRLSNLIRSAGDEISMIVAVARGGFVPARLLSDGIGVKRLSSIGISYADHSRTKLDAYSIPHPIQRGDRILLVEDVLESGKSLAYARELLANKGATVWTAAFYYRTDSVIIPEFSLGIQDRIPVFPWDAV